MSVSKMKSSVRLSIRCTSRGRTSVRTTYFILQSLLISSSLEVKYGVTKRLFPTVQVNQGPPPAAAQQITAKDAAMAAAVQKAVAMGATIPVLAPAGSPAPSQPDPAAPSTPTTSVTVSKSLLRPT